MPHATPRPLSPTPNPRRRGVTLLTQEKKRIPLVMNINLGHLGRHHLTSEVRALALELEHHADLLDRLGRPALSETNRKASAELQALACACLLMLNASADDAVVGTDEQIFVFDIK